MIPEGKNGILEKFREISRDPLGSLKQWDNQHKGVVGYMLPHVPEELIHAAGLLPVALTANEKEQQASGKISLLTGISCSYMKRLHETSINGDLSTLSGVVVPVMCDSTRVMSDIWQFDVKFDYYEVFHAPRTTIGKHVADYTKGELLRLKASLENHFKVQISDQAIAASIKLYNANRAVLTKLHTLWSDSPQLMSNRDFYTVVKCSALMPKQVHTEWTQALLTELAKEQAQLQEKKEYIRLAGFGKLWDPPQILDLLYEQGAVLVTDGFSLGVQYFSLTVDEKTPWMDALIKHQLDKMLLVAGFVCPTEVKEAKIAGMLKDARAVGAIYFLMKFCDPVAYDYPHFKTFLNGKGIPTLALETDLESMHLERLKTQIGAFLEMQKGA